MQPTIRLTDYIEEYKKMTYSDYAGLHNIVLTTYYQIDDAGTIYDPNFMDTFHKTGELSGKRWNKIHLFPVIFSQAVQPAINSNEKGVNYFNETKTFITIDPICGLIPHLGDLFSFSINGDYSSWVITNYEVSGTLENPYYKCAVDAIRIRNDTFTTTKVVTENIFLEFKKKIYRIEDGSNMLSSLSRLEKLIDNINDCFVNCIQYHKINDIVLFPELEVILFSHDSLRPPQTALYGDVFDSLNINTSSLFSMYCLPSLYVGINNPVTTAITDQYLNTRLHTYRRYKEYITSVDGDIDIPSLIYPNTSTINEFNLSLNAMKDYYLNSNITNIDNASSSITKLTNEFLNERNNTFVSGTDVIATNFFEMVFEHCILSRNILKLDSKSVVLS